MNALVAQCGGPTCVVNATLAAIVEGWQRGGVGSIWGARWGFQGLVHHNWVNLSDLSSGQLNVLRLQPGAALGGGRQRLNEGDLPSLFNLLHDHHVGCLFLIGGNGTMSAAQRLLTAAQGYGFTVHSQPLQVLGAPKTIDNDLMGVDVSPGYGSAARFIAQTTRNVALDLASMVGFDRITVVETMGRHTGWLAAASALGRERSDDPPHLIFFPEKQIDDGKLIAAIDDAYRRHGVCLVATSEGLRDGEGRFYAEKMTGAEKDASGQTLLSLSGGVAAYLAHLVQKQLGLRCRQIRFDVVQRSASASVSPVDRSLAAQVGAFAVELALAGQSGVMAGLARTEDGWSNAARLLEEASGRERELPHEFMDAERHDVTPAFIDYCAPLVGELDLQAVHLH